jgi:hypothetical protein
MTDALTEESANRNEQSARTRAMWSAVALTSINDAIRHAARESKNNKGRALKTLTLWANTKDGRDVLRMAGIDPDKRVTDSMIAFAAKGVLTARPRKTDPANLDARDVKG